jgi:HTH-type transcriptional regulator / antitoxin MqsA
MAKKFNGKRCPTCLQSSLQHEERNTTFDYRGAVLRYKQVGAWCQHCDECVMTGAETEATAPQIQRFMAEVDEAERKLLLRVREKLQLTQRQAARLTGGGHNAFSRYERGEAQPLPAVVNLFRLLDKHPELVNELIVSFKEA